MRIEDWFGRLVESPVLLWLPMLFLVGVVGVGSLILWRARDKARVAAPAYWVGVFCVALVWLIALFRLRLCLSIPIAATVTFVCMNLIPLLRARRR